MKHPLSHLFLTLALILVRQLTTAYNSENSLVQTFDMLTVFDETNTEVGEWKLTSFPYIDGVSLINAKTNFYVIS